ncbi:hypothetical protein PM082_008909 [Marasmius tenuissimus]|nr:hypothetical protein PM082_008909 [Marasmius tenuissimus]
MIMMLSAIYLLSAIAICYLLYQRSRRFSISRIPGPGSPSLLVGNYRDIFTAQAAEADLKWVQQYGGVVRFKAPFGEDRLLISDPKAIHHIFKQGYVWGIPLERRRISLVLAGPGLGYAEGEDHKRQKRVINPGFGSQECRALVPVFCAAAASLVDKWRDLLLGSEDDSQVLNIPTWTSLATLDALGHGGFNYDFGALKDNDNVLSTAYRNFFADIFSAPSDSTFVAERIISALPRRLALWLLENAPDPRLARGRAARDVATQVARELIEAKTKELQQGGGGNDVLSLLGMSGTFHSENILRWPTLGCQSNQTFRRMRGPS